MHAIDYQDADVGNQLVASLQHIGFAVLRNHPLDTPLLDQLYGEWLAFFHSSDKHNYRFREDVENGTQEGYIPPEVSETAVGETAKDLKEFYHVVPGGRVPETLQQNIEAFRAAAFALGRELGALIQASMPAQAAQLLSEPLTDMFSAEDSMLRVLHYPPLSDADQNTEAVRAAAHEDINLITLLPVSEQPGLQVKDVHGQWLELPSQPGDLVINTGDMLSEATNGFYPSTTHRVVNPTDASGNVSRVSIPYFLGARPDVVLSDRHTAGSYLQERLDILNA